MTKLREPRWLSHQRLRFEWFLGAALEDGEEVLARGRLRTGESVVVTPRKIAWEGSWEGSSRSVASLPFDQIERAQQIIEETHRYAIALTHPPIDRPRSPALLWDLPGHWRRFRQRRRPSPHSVLRFSRRETAVARAIRAELALRGIPLGSALVRPHHRQEAGYLRRLRGSEEPPVD